MGRKKKQYETHLFVLRDDYNDEDDRPFILFVRTEAGEAVEDVQKEVQTALYEAEFRGLYGDEAFQFVKSWMESLKKRFHLVYGGVCTEHFHLPEVYPEEDDIPPALCIPAQNPDMEPI